jgi:hypothetical protein
MSTVAHKAAIGAQLSGGLAVTKSHIAASSERVTVAQLASPSTPLLKAVAVSAMQAEYCATVTVQLAGIVLQLGLAAPAFRQELSRLVQFC